MRESCGRSRDAVVGAVDAALEEGTTRRSIVGRGALAAAALIGGISLLSPRARSAGAAPSAALDARIFNFALLLEYLQAAFYGDAVEKGQLKGEVRDFAETVAEHERQHVDYLRGALGRHARRRPSFSFGDATSDQRKFLETAVLLENTGVAAYNGQAASLTKKALAAAAEIVSVEGRHAAWISDLAGESPAPRAADPGASAREVVAALHKTGFLTSTST
jgi:rubrerythrin